MALKRKRSSPAFSSPASEASDATSQSSPLPFFYHHSKPVASLYDKPTWSWPTYEDDHAGHTLSSRTKKRHRDNRPDEQQVYGASCWIGAVIDMGTLADVCRVAASTINRLYEAQKLHPKAEPVISQEAEASRPAQPQRSTLHSFWKIAQPPTAVSRMIDSGPQHNAMVDMKCEDCERSLQHEDVMELDDGVYAQETSCQSCHRKVCDTCAVLGDQRVCLACVSGGLR